VRTRTVVGEVDGDEVSVRLEAWRDASDPALSRFEPVAEGVASIAAPEVPEPIGPVEGDTVDDPYATGKLFHGPRFQVLTEWTLGQGVAGAVLDAARDGVPRGHLGQGVLDALTHAIPHDGLASWDAAIGDDQVAYPYCVESLDLFGPTPEGEVEVRVRYLGLEDGRFPRFALQAVDRARGALWVSAVLREVLFPKGPIGMADPGERRQFLLHREPVAGLGLSTVDGESTTVTAAAVKQSDWLPGTVAALYRSDATGEDLLRDVAAGDHVARLGGVHPGTVRLDEVGTTAISRSLPLTRWPVSVVADARQATVRSTGPDVLDLSPVQAYWAEFFDRTDWPVEDVYYGLMQRFLRRVIVPEPDALQRIHGRSVLYLANHQVAVESLWFSIIASALNGMNTVTLAKVEHKTTWMGHLIRHSFAYPGVPDPEVITFFDRADKASLPRIIGDLSRQMTTTGKSVMVHVEGTRSLSCRRAPVTKMSSSFIDMALATGAPIVPVRFSGGLPTEELPRRNEYPFQMGQQDVTLGSPIEPEVLQALPFKDRKDFVLDALNTLGPPWSEEEPLPGDEPLLERSLAWAEKTGASPPYAALLEMLAERDHLTAGIQRIVAERDAEQVRFDDTPEGAWLATLAGWLYGPRGPKVVRG